MQQRTVIPIADDPITSNPSKNKHPGTKKRMEGSSTHHHTHPSATLLKSTTGTQIITLRKPTNRPKAFRPPSIGRRKVGLYTPKIARNIRNRILESDFDYSRCHLITLPYTHDVTDYAREIRKPLKRLQRRVRKEFPDSYGLLIREWYEGTSTPHFHAIFQSNSEDEGMVARRIIRIWMDLIGCDDLTRTYSKRLRKPESMVSYLSKPQSKNPSVNLKGLGRCWCVLGRTPPKVPSKIILFTEQAYRMMVGASIEYCKATGRVRTGTLIERGLMPSVRLSVSRQTRSKMIRFMKLVSDQYRHAV